MVTVFWVSAEKILQGAVHECLTIFRFLSILQPLMPFKGSLNEGRKPFPNSCENAKNRVFKGHRQNRHSRMCKFTDSTFWNNTKCVHLTLT